MATRTTKGSRRRTTVRKRAAARRVVKIHYRRTRGGRVCYQPINEAGTKGLSASYASRQGARRAAVKHFKGARVVAVVAA